MTEARWFWRPVVAAVALTLMAPIGAYATGAAQAVAASGVWVGAHATEQSAAGWKRTNTDLGAGKLTFSRDFSPSIPPAGNEPWRKTKAPHTFYSVKPPKGDVTGYIDGKYDDQLTAVAKGLPAGSKFTVYHEPEDNMSGAVFAKLTRKTVDVVHRANARVEVWYVAMAYQWRTNSKGNVSSHAGWIDAAKAADAVGIDIYASKGNAVSMDRDKGFQRWWKEIVTPSKKKWGVPERGIENVVDADARVAILNRDWKVATTRGADCFLYWNNDQYRLTDAKEFKAYRAIAASGRTS